jgi:hypothetical protein
MLVFFDEYLHAYRIAASSRAVTCVVAPGCCHGWGMMQNTPLTSLKISLVFRR